MRSDASSGWSGGGAKTLVEALSLKAPNLPPPGPQIVATTCEAPQRTKPLSQPPWVGCLRGRSQVDALRLAHCSKGQAWVPGSGPDPIGLPRQASPPGFPPQLPSEQGEGQTDVFANLKRSVNSGAQQHSSAEGVV